MQGNTRRRIGRALCLALAAVSAGWGGPAPAEEAPFRQQQDLVYAEVDGAGLLADLFLPRGQPNGRAVVDVASGAWHSDRGKIRDHAAARVFHTFCERGYVVFAARPGSRNRYTLTEMVQHVRLAVLYARRRAEELGFAPNRLGLMGASAGGHLALMASLAPHQAMPEARDPLLRQDGNVQATAVFFPPTDFLDWRGDGKPADLSSLRPLFFGGEGAGRGREEVEAAAKSVSPLHRVTRTATPFLLIHGDADTVVPLSQSRRFVAAMKDAGNSVELIVKPGGGHPWPTIAEEVRVVADWFDRRL